MTWPRALPLALLLALLLPRLAGLDPGQFSLGLLLAYLIPAGLLCYGCRDRPLLFGAAIAAILLAGAYDKSTDEIAVARGFFGVNRIIARDGGDG